LPIAEPSDVDAMAQIENSAATGVRQQASLHPGTPEQRAKTQALLPLSPAAIQRAKLAGHLADRTPDNNGQFAGGSDPARCTG
jgi:hypothetical protein